MSRAGWSGCLVLPALLTLGAASAVGLAAAPADQTRADKTLAQTKMELLRSSLEPPEGPQTSPGLEKTINRLRAIELEPQTPRKSDLPQAQSQPASMPAYPTSAPAAASGPDPMILAKFRQISAKGVANPAELADALYVAGQTEVAEAFYERALAQATEAATRAWLMFQLANCRRKTDPEAAKQLYQRLGEEYTASSWRSIALLRIQLIEWYEINDPQQVLAGATEQIARLDAGSPTDDSAPIEAAETQAEQ